jgi:2-dehydropantoate 2-reductase
LADDQETVVISRTQVATVKVVVIAAGAVGSVVGGLLSKAGEDVTLIARKTHVEAMNQNGLVLDGPSGRMTIRVKAAENLDFRPDLALLTVKTQDVESSVKEVQSLLSGVLLVTMQNGVRSDDIAAELLGKENIVSGVVINNDQFLEPGRVSYSIPFSELALLVGEPFRTEGERLQSLSALLNKALPTATSKDIRGAHWTKLIFNLTNAVPAVTGLSFQEGTQYRQIRELNLALLREGLKVAEMAGIKTAPVPGFPLTLAKTLVRMPLQISLPLMAKRMEQSLGQVPVLGSTLQSIKRGRRTEIDYLNGEIVNLGKKIGIPTPVNSLIVELVHQVETAGKFLTVDELGRRLT